jgi:hypothetical protein
LVSGLPRVLARAAVAASAEKLAIASAPALKRTHCTLNGACHSCHPDSPTYFHAEYHGFYNVQSDAKLSIYTFNAFNYVKINLQSCFGLMI